ncbi:hypothetical protein F5X98DRAFT_382625 [Xylaria grammica]|nr:hypothetical protein F5X98DRAFT_382625 [Xylaria grammica]
MGPNLSIPVDDRLSGSVVRGSLACIQCFITARFALLIRDDIPVNVVCIRKRPFSRCQSCEDDTTGCEPVSIADPILFCSAAKVNSFLQYCNSMQLALTNCWPGLSDAPAHFRTEISRAQVHLLEAFIRLINTHCESCGLKELSDIKDSYTYQTLVSQRKALMQQSFQPIHFGADPATRASYARATALRVQPFDTGYAAWMLAVRAFMAELEEHVVDEYGQARWDDWRPLLPNEDVLEFYDG